jgi:hypothetical protein
MAQFAKSIEKRVTLQWGELWEFLCDSAPTDRPFKPRAAFLAAGWDKDVVACFLARACELAPPNDRIEPAGVMGWYRWVGRTPE